MSANRAVQGLVLFLAFRADTRPAVWSHVPNSAAEIYMFTDNVHARVDRGGCEASQQLQTARLPPSSFCSHGIGGHRGRRIVQANSARAKMGTRDPCLAWNYSCDRFNACQLPGAHWPVWLVLPTPVKSVCQQRLHLSALLILPRATHCSWTRRFMSCLCTYYCSITRYASRHSLIALPCHSFQ